MAFSLNLNRTFCSFACCNTMSFRDKLDHIIYAYDSISMFPPCYGRQTEAIGIGIATARAAWNAKDNRLNQQCLSHSWYCFAMLLEQRPPII